LPAKQEQLAREVAHLGRVVVDASLPRMPEDRCVGGRPVAEDGRAGLARRLTSVLAKLRDPVAHEMEPHSHRPEPTVVFPVFLVAQRQPRPRLCDDGGSVERRGRLPPTRLEHGGEDRPHFFARTLPGLGMDASVAKTHPRPAVRHVTLGMALQTRDLQLELAGLEEVVAVEVLDELTLGRQPPGLPCSADAGVRLVNNSHLGMKARQAVGRGSGVVGGSIVYDDDFDGPVGLGEDAGHRLPEHGCPVEDRDDRRNEPILHEGTISQPGETMVAVVTAGRRTRYPSSDVGAELYFSDMCGIAGWLDAAPRPEAHLSLMADAIAHRGPDDRGTYYVPADGIGLVHNRLSIIDLSDAGHEPMFNEDGTVVLVFNGEIYNFEALRAELIARGHSFRSRTDCEVVVHGYEEWGEAVVGRLQGMFAFAVWDARTRRLFIARDPMGIKPVYYWISPSGGLYFASEIKALVALPDFRAEPNPRALRQFLELNFISDIHESSLRGVFKLPSGHTLTIEVGRARDAKPCRYFIPPPTETDETPADEEALTERLYQVLDEVVGEHLIADVPVALLLSGGLDSSLVAALASRRRPIRTITMAFADSVVDERPFARALSRHVGSEHEEIVIQPSEVAAEVGRAAWYVDDLFGDWGLFSTMLLYRRSREAGAKVVLVGEGSDELFGGYPAYTTAGGEAADSSTVLSRGLRLYRWYSGRRWGRELLPFLRTVGALCKETDGDFFSTIRLFETRHQLPSNYNMKVDRASMAASVEARVPFLDVRVAKLAFTLPRSLLLRGGSNKYLLRRVAERYSLLPPDLIARPKFGASMAASWMDEIPSFRAFAREVVLDSSGWVDQLGLRPAMEDYFSGRRRGYRFPHGLSIFSILAWRLLLLNLWSRHYLRAVARAA